MGCSPIRLRFDHLRIASEIEKFLDFHVFSSHEERLKKLHAPPFGAVNINHIPGLVGSDHWFKFSGNKYALQKANVEESAFTELCSELRGTYVEEVINTIEQFHYETFKQRFSGRYQLLWVNPGACYPLHRDFHTPHRYHIPIVTNPEALWILRDHEEFTLLHMPADGRAWYLNPVQQEHTVVNLGNASRYHLLMTTAKN